VVAVERLVSAVVGVPSLLEGWPLGFAMAGAFHINLSTVGCFCCFI